MQESEPAITLEDQDLPVDLLGDDEVTVPASLEALGIVKVTAVIGISAVRKVFEGVVAKLSENLDEVTS